MRNMQDTDGGEYTNYGALRDAMLQYCEHPEAQNVAAGFGNTKTTELLEFIEQGFDEESGRFDLAKAASAFDKWIGSE